MYRLCYMNQPFGGDKKVGQSILHALEQKAIQWAAPKVPQFLTSRILTLLSLPISLAVILFSYLATLNIHWLWGASFFIFLQWATDSLDGTVGKMRGEGLVRWGYYMDHFLDYIFLCSILTGYMLLVPDEMKYLQFFILVVGGAFMANGFLAFGATHQFRIVHGGIGPTEIRIIFIFINTLIILFGKTHLAFSLPYLLIGGIIGLSFIVYKTQKQIYELDMEAKHLSK